MPLTVRLIRFIVKSDQSLKNGVCHWRAVLSQQAVQHRRRIVNGTELRHGRVQGEAILPVRVDETLDRRIGTAVRHHNVGQFVNHGRGQPAFDGYDCSSGLSQVVRIHRSSRDSAPRLSQFLDFKKQFFLTPYHFFRVGLGCVTFSNRNDIAGQFSK